MRIAFRFKLIPCVATVLLVALGIALGNWQRHRAETKTAMAAQLAAGNAAAPLQLGAAPLAPEAVEWRRLQVRGQFVRDWPVYLDNRPYQGRAGFYLLMPFRIAGSGMHVLVERGWLPRDLVRRDKLPATATPAGEVLIEGVARSGTGHVMQLGSAAPLRPGAIVQNVGPAELAVASGLALQPFVLEQAAPASPGKGEDEDDLTLVRDWPAPALGVDKHRGYAFQWYALALMALIFFVVTGLRSGKQHAN